MHRDEEPIIVLFNTSIRSGRNRLRTSKVLDLCSELITGDYEFPIDRKQFTNFGSKSVLVGKVKTTSVCVVFQVFELK